MGLIEGNPTLAAKTKARRGWGIQIRREGEAPKLCEPTLATKTKTSRGWGTQMRRGWGTQLYYSTWIKASCVADYGILGAWAGFAGCVILARAVGGVLGFFQHLGIGEAIADVDIGEKIHRPGGIIFDLLA